MNPTSFSNFREMVLDAAERLQDPLVRYVSRFLNGDINASHDVVQHAFLQLCRAGTEPGRKALPEPVDRWLYCVCRNRAIDVRRAAGREIPVYGSALDQRVDERLSDIEDRLSNKELYQLVRHRVAQLPDSQQEAIDLWSSGLGYADIAAVMEKPETTIRVLVHRAITRLRHDKSLAAASGKWDLRDRTPSPVATRSSGP
jgi:RNA polymerase sigma factor (sigma-70 family)